MPDQIISLSALQHYLYCPRQCALIHIEQSWAENFFTATGQELHKKTNEAPDETIGDIRILRSLSVYSTRLGIAGICDVVEHHADGHFFPVEYKRGKAETFTHPFLNETITYGLLPHIQARLLARHLRGDLDAYPPFFTK